MSQLLTYVMFGRTDKVRALMESSEYSHFDSWETLYYIAFATRELMESNKLWRHATFEEREKAIENNREMLAYLSQFYNPPKNVNEHFVKFAKDRTKHYQTLDFAEYIGNTAEKLIRRGFPEKDCLLFEAVYDLDYDRALRLAVEGADLMTRISSKSSPQELIDDTEHELSAITTLRYMEKELNAFYCDEELVELWTDTEFIEDERYFEYSPVTREMMEILLHTTATRFLLQDLIDVTDRLRPGYLDAWKATVPSYIINKLG